MPEPTHSSRRNPYPNTDVSDDVTGTRFAREYPRIRWSCGSRRCPARRGVRLCACTVERSLCRSCRSGYEGSVPHGARYGTDPQAAGGIATRGGAVGYLSVGRDTRPAGTLRRGVAASPRGWTRRIGGAVRADGGTESEEQRRRLSTNRDGGNPAQAETPGRDEASGRFPSLLAGLVRAVPRTCR